MFADEVQHALPAKLRGRLRQRIPTRATPARDAAVVAEIVHAATGKTALVSQEATADQAFITLRRVDGPLPSQYEILGPMESPGSASDSEAVASSGGVSAFIARVLDQLTLSAWLPAALLTASAAILLQFRGDRSVNVLTAIRTLTADPVRVLVLLVPLLVIATIVTQAFSFEAITTLEGYWRRRGPASFARTLMIQCHLA
jgi:hypothetical protein